MILYLCLFLLLLYPGHATSDSFSSLRLVNLGSEYSLVLSSEEEPRFLLGVESPFSLPSSSRLNIEVIDYNGVVIFQKEGVAIQRVDSNRGFINFLLPKDKLSGAGWYKVEARMTRGNELRPVNLLSHVSFVVLDNTVGQHDGFWGIGGLWGTSAATSRFDEATVQLMQRVGVRRLRFFIDWRSMQGGESWQVVWDQMDGVVALCGKNEIDLLPVIMAPIDDALDEKGGGEKSVVAGLPSWKRFVHQMVKRYGSHVRSWEIWNEANVKGFWRAGIHQYVALLNTAGKIIHKVDPEAQVIIAGTSGVDVDWISAVVQRADTEAYDAIAIHSYRFPDAEEHLAIPQRGDYGGRQLVDDIDLLIKLVGAKKEIIISEFSINTHMMGKKLFKKVSLEVQAERLVKHAVIAKAAGVSSGYWWMLVDGFGAGLGLFSRDWSGAYPKPSLAALSTLNKMMKVDSKVEPTSIGKGNFEAYQITQIDGRSAFVAWSEENRLMELGCSKGIMLTNLVGGKKTVLPTQGQCSVELSPTPVYIELMN